jgi:translation initiation factor eIF-2B subunit delta
MLVALKAVIQDYATPVGTFLQKHLTSTLSRQIGFLNATRSLATSMKTAIRFIKCQISLLDVDMTDEDAKAELCNIIDNFIQEKIVLAGKVIIDQMIDNQKLKSSDVILTFGYSSVVLSLFEAAKTKGLEFRVVVADSRPKLEGKEAVNKLLAAGIPCTYILINTLPIVMHSVIFLNLS